MSYDILEQSLHFDQPKVLLVEDDPVTRWMVRVGIKGQCTLATACDGSKAIKAYEAYKPDLVFLDIGLPDTDGKDLLKRLLYIDPGAYVVMFSSQSVAQTIAETLENGAKGFVSKPFTREDLLLHMHHCPTKF